MVAGWGVRGGMSEKMERIVGMQRQERSHFSSIQNKTCAGLSECHLRGLFSLVVWPASSCRRRGVCPVARQNGRRPIAASAGFAKRLPPFLRAFPAFVFPFYTTLWPDQWLSAFRRERITRNTVMAMTFDQGVCL